MNRRVVLFAGLALPFAPAAANAASGIQVIYVGGQDCPYCSLWRKKYEADWRASPEFREVNWIEVDPPSLREAYQTRYWQGDLRGILDQVPRKNGTPRFLIVKNGKVVFNELGVDKWRRAMLALKNVLE
jgi:hypothetical protein